MAISKELKERLIHALTDVKISEELETMVNEAASSLEYSTSETDTGKKWFDGKRIFRKVIPFGALGNGTNTDIPHGISSIDSLVEYGGYMKQNNGIIVPLSNGDRNETDSIGVSFIDATNINMWVGSIYNGVAASVIGAVVLEYTKA